MESQHNNNNNPPTNHRDHRDRHAIPNPPNRSHPVFSLLKPLNLSTRPFLIQNHAARGGHSIHIPPLNVQINQLNSLTHLNSLSRPVLQPTQPEPEPKPQIKCQFCNESFDSEDILGHASDCDMQRISCERCGDRVPMDVYDVHFEECSSMDNRMEAIEPRSPVMYRRNMNQMEDDEDSEEPEVIDEMDMYLQEDSLSYEQLLRLDENVVKKGMTEEQMKEFKVQLYVKSLDGEGTCRICICDYETAEYTRELSCRHKFHKQCIDKWLEANITCPMCKKYLR